MGLVYLATTLAGGDPVAIKELRSEEPDGRLPAGAVRQFQGEAEILRRLDHPNLPRVYDFVEEDDAWYLVMEYIDGCTLADVLIHEGVLDESRVLEWARQLCEVLGYLHGRRPPVIFRDLKPGNVMLEEGERIRLIDFGIAKFYECGPGVGTHTTVRGLLSPGFAAPEQYGGGTDARSDIYSLGATLYCVLTRELPPDAVDVATGRAPRVDVLAARPDLAPRTAMVIESMLEVERGRRPRSVLAVMDAFGFLEAAVDPPTGAFVQRDLARRHPARSEGAALPRPLTAPPALRRGAAERRVAPLERDLVRPEPPVLASPGRAGRGVWIVALFAVLTLIVGGVVWARRSSPSAPRPGSLLVSSDPESARLYLDDQDVGVTPERLEGIAPGRHVVRVEREDFTPVREAVVVDEGGSSNLHVMLRALPVASAPPPQEPPQAAAPSRPVAIVAESPPREALPVPTAAPSSPLAPTPSPRPAPLSRPSAIVTTDVPPRLRPVPPPLRPDSAHLIVPGQGVGPLTLGSSLDDIKDSPIESQFEGELMLVFRGSGLAVIPREGRIGRIVIAPFLRGTARGLPLYATAGGVRLGAKAETAVREFGTPREEMRVRDVEWSWPDVGLRLQVGEGVVHVIMVEAP
jgi:hypothetical protein